MAAVVKKAALVLAVPALMGTGVFAGSAAADPAAEATAGVAVTPADPASFASCPAGAACYYTGPDGTGRMCAWQNASRQHADDCSWAGDTSVRSIFNNGRDPGFAGLCSYRFPNFDKSGFVVWQARGRGVNLPPAPPDDPGRWKVLSHKWVRGVGVGAC